MFSIGDWLGILTLAGGAVGALIGGARWLIGIYAKKDQENARLKNEYRVKEINAINDSIGELKKVTTEHTNKIQTATLALEKSYLRYNAQSESISALATQVRAFSSEVRDEMKGMRSTVQELSRDMLLIRSRKN